MDKFKYKIKELRHGRNITQQRLADDLNVSKQAVSKWEKGRSLPDITSVEMLATYFGVSTDYLLNDEIEIKTNGVDPATKENTGRGVRTFLAKREKQILWSVICFLLVAVIVLSVCVGVALAKRDNRAVPDKVEVHGIEITYLKSNSYSMRTGGVDTLRLSFGIYNTTDKRIDVRLWEFSLESKKGGVIQNGNYTYPMSEGEYRVFDMEVVPNVGPNLARGTYTVYYRGYQVAKYKL